MATTIEQEPLPVPLPCEVELLKEAQAICREMLAEDPRQPRLLNLFGLIAAREGRHEIAVRCFTRAVEFEPDNAVYFADLASSLARVGRDADAASACLHALRLTPDNAETYRQLAQSLHRQKRLAEATAMYEECLRLRPDDGPTIAELGDVLRARECWAEALEFYEKYLSTTPSAAADAWRRIGQLRLGRREWKLALAAFREGIKVERYRADLHCGVGQALMGLGEWTDAVAALRSALNAEPMHGEASSQLVCALELLGRAHDSARAWLHLGVVLEAGGQFDEAVVALQQALARKADCLEALLRLGDVNLTIGRPLEAIRQLRTALAIDPKHGIAHFNLGCALQLTGEPDNGWDEFAWLCHPLRIKAWRALEQPMWDGLDLTGKTILLWAGLDYGLGDSLHLARFARHVKRRGARVVVECQHELIALFARMPDVDRAIARGAPLPRFDVHAPFMWVPIVDRTARSLIPDDVPYFSVDPVRTARWRERLGGLAGKRVGLCWGGQSTRSDARSRFAPLTALAPLGSVAGISLISLQRGPQADELVCQPSGLYVGSLLHGAASIADTAALMTNLDLVITVDTMIAHLAGTLGVRVWTMLPYGADWKWQTGDETAWYPTMRLFRQAKVGDWAAVVERIRSALEVWTSSATRTD